MRSLNFSSLFLLFLMSGSLLASSNKEACPGLLEAAHISDVPIQEIRQQFQDMNEDGTFDFEATDVANNFKILRNSYTSKFKIIVEELDSSDRSDAEKRMEFNCPVVKSWQAISFPVVEVTKPKAVLDFADPDSPKATSLVRGGIELTRLFPGHENFYSTAIYWRISAKNLRPQWPELVSSSSRADFIQDMIPEEETLPLVGLQISKSSRFGDIWYLLTEKAKDQFKAGNQEILSKVSDGYSDVDERGSLSPITARLERLAFYDARNSVYLTCDQALNPFAKNSCYKLSYQLNPELWDHLKNGEKIYVRLLLKLKLGYLNQVYQVGGEGDREPILVGQTYEASLEGFNLPQSASVD